MPEQSCAKCGRPVETDKPCSHCLLQLAAQPTDVNETTLDLEAIRRAFSQLEILEPIGRGGMGTVFKARQPKLDRFVALKILAADFESKPSFAERFAQEGKLLARLNHPNIVAVYDFGESGGFYYLLMEYVDGVNLRQAMQEERFTPEQAIAIVPKICDALQYAHDEGVLHRDIKPENILLDAKGRVKIADFGIAKIVTAERQEAEVFHTQTGQILGTPSYMAPEQLHDPNRVDHRADIYSLGVVFYELLTGELPQGYFSPRPSEKTPVGADIDSIVLKAMHAEREKRQQSAEEMKTEIETAAAGASEPPKKQSWWDKIDAEMKTWPVWLTTLVFCFVALVLVKFVPLMIVVFLFLIFAWAILRFRKWILSLAWRRGKKEK
ncbi:MAG: serine/threonine protein kinase [Planctomycetaceae bacterium]|nr:serine/threonine protein kinase [Planctomycetaceae bacterium]